MLGKHEDSHMHMYQPCMIFRSHFSRFDHQNSTLFHMAMWPHTSIHTPCTIIDYYSTIAQILHHSDKKVHVHPYCHVEPRLLVIKGRVQLEFGEEVFSLKGAFLHQLLSIFPSSQLLGVCPSLIGEILENIELALEDHRHGYKRCFLYRFRVLLFFD